MAKYTLHIDFEAPDNAEALRFGAYLHHLGLKQSGFDAQVLNIEFVSPRVSMLRADDGWSVHVAQPLMEENERPVQP